MPQAMPTRTPVPACIRTSRGLHAPARAIPHARARYQLDFQERARSGPCGNARPSAPADTQDAGGADTEEDIPASFPSFNFGADTSGAGPSFQGTSTVSNDEVLARMLSVFDTRLTGMESMITDRFRSLEITQGSIDSRLNTLQGQLQTILHLLQPPPHPPPEA
ncbi:hypothetical protein JCGZ_26739 [Jatropha curcas]|uniref:Uncharacterized protein n=1 Tax=Jatropha curcas TaxID=180498 RepID=A0A067JJB0_JATCU|nr:hypothetical protein JCGZ_26739 [Jatropha curcas]